MKFHKTNTRKLSFIPEPIRKHPYPVESFLEAPTNLRRAIKCYGLTWIDSAKIVWGTRLGIIVCEMEWSGHISNNNKT